jgi:hypothetical protein
VGEYDAAAADKMYRMILFDCWRWQLEGRHLTRAGLLGLRARLDEVSNEFRPGVDLDNLRLMAADALAEDMGIPPEDLPDAPVAPDFPDDIPPAPRW